MPTVNYGITATSDDVADLSSLGSGVVTTTLIFGNYFGFDAPGGVRFLNIAVPQGASITSATLTLKTNPSSPGEGSTFGVIKGGAYDTSPPFTTTRPGLYAKTTESVAVASGEPLGLDVTAIVQAIVNRGGWASGNSLAFVGETGSADGFRGFIDYNTSSTDCAQLSITYEEGGPDETPPTITSSDTLSVSAGNALNHTLTANEAVTWSIIGGADAASFSLTGANLTLPGQAFPSGPFVVEVEAEDAATNTSTQTITVSIAEGPRVTYEGGATGTTTATMPAGRAPGDIAIAFAFRDGSTTPPALPAGWTQLFSGAGSAGCSARIAYREIVTGTETTGTFTSASSTLVALYRPASGRVLSIGDFQLTAASGVTVSYPALTLETTDGSSWVVGMAGHRQTNTALETPPTGMSNRLAVVDTVDESVLHDTAAGVSGWSLQTVGVGGSSSGWIAATLEIKSTEAGGDPVRAPRAFAMFID